MNVYEVQIRHKRLLKIRYLVLANDVQDALDWIMRNTTCTRKDILACIYKSKKQP